MKQTQTPYQANGYATSLIDQLVRFAHSSTAHLSVFACVNLVLTTWLLFLDLDFYELDLLITYRNSERRLKLPWWSPELEGLKKDAHTKKRRIRNTTPSRREYVVGEYVQAKEVYERAATEAQPASRKRFCSAQDGKSLWDSICRIIRKTGKNREDVLLQTDPGRVLGPNESTTLLTETFFPDDRVDTEIRIMRKSEGKPTGMISHP
ncbi:hypothetical protein EVAR_60517_1 [Eumeta japonica]|uniref:Uncharacterized protein n=1 Tax=Eumeta variegata TaxID=151549 RepID=A0A4C1ZDL9_EUMVA|nr:hypothetical protein EVAR_60517_1 [Eumeta japonica]